MNAYLSFLRDQHQKAAEYLDKIELIVQEFDDLHQYDCRWAKVLCSKKVNAIADNVRLNHSCGCCADAMLYAMPYIERHGIKIYQDPPEIWIGCQEHYGGDLPHKDWQSIQGITPVLIPIIEKYFEDNKPNTLYTGE